MNIVGSWLYAVIRIDGYMPIAKVVFDNVRTEVRRRENDAGAEASNERLSRGSKQDQVSV